MPFVQWVHRTAVVNVWQTETADVFGFLVGVNGVLERDGCLSSLPVADDQFLLAFPDGYQSINGLDTSVWSG